MKVIVEIITGTFIDTEVSENATVEELKENIAAEVKLPVKRLILVVGDEEERRLVMDNEDYMILRDLGVGEYSHIYLFFKHPDMVSEEDRSRGGDDDPMEKISSETEKEEEKANINEEEKDEAMKDEEEGEEDILDEKVEDGKEEEREKKVKEEKEDNDDVEEESGDNKEIT